MRALTRAAVVLVLVVASWTAQAATLPSGFRESIVLDGLQLPTVARFASDGRIFVAEKSGLVKVFDGLGDPSPDVFADLRTNVHNFGDRGLLGLALHPDFPSTPYVYVLYTADAAIGGTPPRWGSPGVTSDGCPNPPGTSNGCVVSGRLSRLEAAGNHATGGETILLENWCQQFSSHSMGTLRFGPDGELYVSAGDGASYTAVDYGQYGSPQVNPCGDPPAGVGGAQQPSTSHGGSLRSQNLELAGSNRAALNGKILRVDPLSGAAAPGNPLAGSAVPAADRIIARGLRNPFRFTFRPGTTELWIGDVGWVDYEEIDRFDVALAALPNFGWPCYEGDAPQSAWSVLGSGVCNDLYATPNAVVRPYFTYHRSEHVVPGDDCLMEESSISGIAFYPGGDYPAAYDGALFFADYSRQCIWTMFAGADGAPDPSTRTPFIQRASGPVDLEIGPGGDLFYVDIAGGTLRRVSWSGGNQPPVAVLTADHTSGVLPLTVHFDASASHDPDSAGPLSFDWDLDGDGVFGDASGATATHTFTAAGDVVVSVRVSDGTAAAVATLDVSPGNTPPVVTIAAPVPPLGFAVGDVVAFAGSAVDAEDGPLPASALTWSLTLRHCPGACHTHPVQDFAGVDGGSFEAPDHETPSHLELTLTATDSGGLSASVTISLEPRTVELTFASVPAGLTLGVGATAEPTPFTRSAAVRSKNAVSAPARQTLGGVEWLFQSWSDGGGAVHDVVAGESDATVTATYTGACAVDAECDDHVACTDDVCTDGRCVSTTRSCPAADACHGDGACDPATGACRAPDLDAAGAACVLRAPLDGVCAGDALSAKLRRRVGRKLRRADALLAALPESTGRRAERRVRAMDRVLHGVLRRVDGSGHGARIAEPCRTRLAATLGELLQFTARLGTP